MSPRDKLAPHIRDHSPLDLCMVGGNHLASALIGKLGPDFHERYPPGSDAGKARKEIGDQVLYDAWCCWSMIMIAREISETMIRSPRRAEQ